MYCHIRVMVKAYRLQARNALVKVEKIFSPDKRGDKKRQRSGETSSDLGNFLQGYILAIISHVTDALQSVKGMRTPESKCQILRSIGMLSQILGSEISAIAPQVSYGCILLLCP
jgi:hypothetical protein